jgi:putative aldouronate transport system substrate-binding protein
MESSFDMIDRTALIGVIFGTTKVCSVFDDPGVVERYQTMHKWYEAGYVNPDAPTLDENAIDSKLHHIGFTQAWTGYSYYGSRGFSTEYARYAGPVLSTDLLLGSLQCISATLEEDEARFKKALQFLELLCTNKEYRDTIAYGIEGEHFNYYDVNDIDGNYLGKAVVRTELGRSNYTPWLFNQGNYSLATPAFDIEEVKNGHPLVNQWDLYYKEIEGAPVSSIAGFQFNYQDPIDFTQAYAEISAIKQEFFSSIQCGTVDPDVAIPEMRAKMEEAGLNDIIAEAQRQLDAYLASK